MDAIEKFCESLLDNKVFVKVFLAVVVLLIVVILMKVYKVGSAEHLGDSGVEIPVDYWQGVDSSGFIIPNQYGGNSTGGLTRGAAGRFGQENTSGTVSKGDGRDYVYTTRLDTNLRSYNNTDSAAFIQAHGGI